MTPHPRPPSLLLAASMFGPGAPSVAPAAPPLPAPRRVVVSRRTWEGMQPRPKRVPQTAEDSARLRKAELKRRAKAGKRARAFRRALPIVGLDPTEATP